MKIIKAVFLLLIVSITATAQKNKSASSPGTSFGILVGIDARNMYGKESNGDKTDGDIAIKYHAGLNAEIPAGKDLVFQPGIILSAKGTQQESSFLGVSFKQKINLFYLDIPLNFVYKPVLGTGKLLLGVGPYVGFGVGGKVKTKSGNTEVTSDVEYRNTVKATDPDDVAYLKRMDAGLNFLAGYQFRNNISLQLNSSMGLLNVNPEYESVTNDESKAKHIGFGVSIGYRFGR